MEMDWPRQRLSFPFCDSEMDGPAFTVTVRVDGAEALEQPPADWATTVYTVVTEGLAITLAPVAVFRVAAGLQE
jgi:hypothetical protein